MKPLRRQLPLIFDVVTPSTFVRPGLGRRSIPGRVISHTKVRKPMKNPIKVANPLNLLRIIALSLINLALFHYRRVYETECLPVSVPTLKEFLPSPRPSREGTERVERGRVRGLFTLQDGLGPGNLPQQPAQCEAQAYRHQHGDRKFKQWVEREIGHLRVVATKIAGSMIYAVKALTPLSRPIHQAGIGFAFTQP